MSITSRNRTDNRLITRFGVQTNIVWIAHCPDDGTTCIGVLSVTGYKKQQTGLSVLPATATE